MQHKNKAKRKIGYHSKLLKRTQSGRKGIEQAMKNSHDISSKGLRNIIHT